MSKLPSYFERKIEEDDVVLPVFPFSYVESDSEFDIAGERISLRQFDPFEFSGFHIEDKAIPYSRMTDYPVLIPGFGGLIAGPKLHDFAVQNSNALIDSSRAMERAYFTLEPDHRDTDTDYLGPGFMSFRAWVREHGGIGLQVLGNCACSGPDLHSYFIRDGIEEGFAEYDLHNTDTQAQRAAIYAGMGHLAFLAASESKS